VREEVDACKALRGVDLFLTHEAPRPYIVPGRAGSRGIDAGKTPVNEILAEMRPRLHLFGHHHRFSDQVRQGVRSVGLDLVSKSYLLIDGQSLELTRRESVQESAV
jgi:Icc-related predicted phosphoesterase